MSQLLTHPQKQKKFMYINLIYNLTWNNKHSISFAATSGFDPSLVCHLEKANLGKNERRDKISTLEIGK